VQKFPNFPRKGSKNFTQYEQLIRDAREGFCAAFHRLAHRCRRGCFSHFRFALRYVELRRFAAKGFEPKKTTVNGFSCVRAWNGAGNPSLIA
jgi:hypothetical protein